MPKRDWSQTIVVKEAIYVPVEYIDTEAAEELYTLYFYERALALKCPNRRAHKELKHCELCPEYNERLEMYKYKTAKGVQYMGFPLGARKKLPEQLGLRFKDFDVLDLRVKKPFDYPVKFTGKLRDYQEKGVAEWMQAKYGLFLAPPRSGKTIVTLSIGIQLGQRFVLLANQYEFLKQFIEHIEDYTNLKQLEQKTGKKLYGYPKTQEDFETMQIMCCTYQQFISETNGPKKLKWLSNNIGTYLVDEVHKANSNWFSKVVSALPVTYRGGFTGTRQRKDGRHVIVDAVIGPVQHEVKRTMLVPKMTVHITPDVKSRSAYKGPAGWVYFLKFICNHEKRNEQILDFVIRDLKKGRSIVIPLQFKEHVFEMTKRINDLWPGPPIADYFVGGTGKQGIAKRDKVIEDARASRIRVVVGIRSLLQLGVNVPRWDCVVGDTLLPTPDGLTRIKDFVGGPEIKTIDQSVYRTSGIYATASIGGATGVKPIKRIVLEHGMELNCSPGQEIMVTRYDQENMVKARKIQNGDSIKLHAAGNPKGSVDPTMYDVSSFVAVMDRAFAFGRDLFGTEHLPDYILQGNYNVQASFLIGLNLDKWSIGISDSPRDSFLEFDNTSIAKEVQQMIFNSWGVLAKLCTKDDKVLLKFYGPEKTHFYDCLTRNKSHSVYNRERTDIVKCVVDCKPQQTYDITMRDSNKPYFVANGMLIHNCLYNVIPISNEPNWKQESSRILTPDEDDCGKGEPLIRFFVDENMAQSTGCFTNTWVQSLKFGYQPTETARERARPLLADRRQADPDLEQMQMSDEKPVRTVSKGLFNRTKRK